MASAPNPFADDLPPDAFISAPINDQRSNPYAPPTIAEPVAKIADKVLGVWRDGNSVVIHQTGDFPNRCLLTNEPEFLRYQHTINWAYPIDWYQRKHTFEFGLSQAGMRQWTQKRRRIIWIRIGVFSLFWGLFFFNIARERWFNFFLVLIPALIVALLIHRGSEFPTLLSFHKHQDGYFWLRGPMPPFLNSLPPWPGIAHRQRG